MTPHSKGPWHVDEEVIVRNAEGLMMATFYSKDTARLIAAAPELLAALEASFRDCHSCMQLPGKEWCDRCKDAHALIARIEGEPEPSPQP